MGLIRVLSADDPEILNSHGRLLEAFIPNLKVMSQCIEGHPKGLWNEEEERQAIPKIVRLGQEMERNEGVDVLFVSCVADPGVPELREVVSVPVIGAGSASAGVALSLGEPVGALSITDWILPPVAEVLGKALVGWERPTHVQTTLDLMSEEGREEITRAGRRLMDKGAGVILLACTGFSTVRLAPFLEDRLRVPVIDPVLSGGLIAYYAAVGNEAMR
ncbi:MAG: hydantoin racemase [Anaerolineales bacterium]|nr:MAG: hydantoin racemase [Anaerolineales bacterium]